jgi:hypothetical protein
MFNFFQPLTDNTSLLDFIIFLFPYLAVVAKLFTNFLNLLGFFKFILSHFLKFTNLLVPYIVKFIARSVNYIYGFAKLQKKNNQNFQSEPNIGNENPQSCIKKNKPTYNKYTKIESFTTYEEIKERLEMPVLGQLYIYE